MSRAQIERRLRAVSEQLRSVRDDLQITDQQLIRLVDEADDARVRALVSETPLAAREHRKASRHADRLRKHRAKLAGKFGALEAEQDRLLDQLSST